MAEAGDRGAVRPQGETQGRHEWASGRKASGGEVTRGRGRDAGDVAEADVVEPVQHGVVQAAPDAGPAPGREPAVSRRLRYAEAERQPSPDTAGDQMADGRWPMAADSVSSGVPCVPPPCGHTSCSGINGFAISHRPSRPIQLAEACGLFVLSGTCSGVTVRSAPLPWPADGRPGSRRRASPRRSWTIRTGGVQHPADGRRARCDPRVEDRRSEGSEAAERRPEGRFTHCRSRRRSAPRPAPPSGQSAAHSRASPGAPMPQVGRSLQPQARRLAPPVLPGGQLDRPIPTD